MNQQRAKWFFIGKILLLVIGSFVCLCGLFEIYLRSQNYLQVQPANYPCSRSDEILNHGIKANCSKFTRGADLKTDKDFLYKTNSYGFRGPEPLESRKKLVVIGDSYTEGFGLAEEETFPEQLEKKLHELGAHNLQVLNGGVISYSTALYPLHFVAGFAKFRPKYVLLNLDLSDFSDDIYFWRIADYGTNGLPIRFPAREVFPRWTLAFIYSNRSAVLRFFHQEVNQIYSAILRRKNEALMRKFLESSPSVVDQAELERAGRPECKRIAELVANSILALKKQVESSGGTLGIHMYPSGQVVKTYPSTYGKSISIVKHWDESQPDYHYFSCHMDEKLVPAFRKFARDQNIDFFDTFPAVLAAKGNKEMYFENDAHWNKHGVRFVTSVLAPQLWQHLKKKF